MYLPLLKNVCLLDHSIAMFIDRALPTMMHTSIDLIITWIQLDFCTALLHFEQWFDQTHKHEKDFHNTKFERQNLKRVAGKRIDVYARALPAKPFNVIFQPATKSFIICDYHNRWVLQWSPGSTQYTSTEYRLVWRRNRCERRFLHFQFWTTWSATISNRRSTWTVSRLKQLNHRIRRFRIR